MMTATYALLPNGVLNIMGNLTTADCEAIVGKGLLAQIQFSRKFEVSPQTFSNVNDIVLAKHPRAKLRVPLNEFGAITNLEVLRWTPSLKNLTVDFMTTHSELREINEYLQLEILGVLGKNVSLRHVTRQEALQELFIGENAKDLPSIAGLSDIVRLTLSKMKVKDLGFLQANRSLKELHFILGGVPDLSILQHLPRLEKISFAKVRGLTQDHLKKVLAAASLQEVALEQQNDIHEVRWLEEAGIRVTTFNCKGLQ
ncbi:MAG: hypothetical protein AAGA85_27605 [Bacteroidota bacterium]